MNIIRATGMKRNCERQENGKEGRQKLQFLKFHVQYCTVVVVRQHITMNQEVNKLIDVNVKMM